MCLRMWSTNTAPKVTTRYYKNLPPLFGLKSELPVPSLMRLIIIPAKSPENGDPDAQYINIIKHIYMHKNKLPVNMCTEACRGVAHWWDHGRHFRVGLLAMNYMLDLMGGMQIRHWVVQPKFTKKQTIDNAARNAGHQFIRDKGPKCNNKNQFMEWTDEQIHTAGSPIENWNEGKVITALQNYMRGRQNVKTLEYWPFTLKSLNAWFCNEVLVHMLPTIRQNAITWLGKTRAGKFSLPRPLHSCRASWDHPGSAGGWVKPFHCHRKALRLRLFQGRTFD